MTLIGAGICGAGHSDRPYVMRAAGFLLPIGTAALSTCEKGETGISPVSPARREGPPTMGMVGAPHVLRRWYRSI